MAIVTVKVSVDYFFRLEEDGSDVVEGVRGDIEENGIPSFLEEGEELRFVTELNDVSLVGSEED